MTCVGARPRPSCGPTVAESPRIALVVAGSRGDAQPFVALALALADFGAQPVLMSHGEHRGLAERHQVAFVELPGDPRELLATRTGLELLATRDPLRALRGLRKLADGLVEDVLAALETALREVDLVVFSTLAVAAYHVAEVLGVPAVWGVLQPVVASATYPSLLISPGRDLGRWGNVASHRLADRLAWILFAPALTDYRVKRGLPKAGPGEVRGSIVTLGGWSSLLAPAPPDWPATASVTGAWMLPPALEPPLDRRIVDFLHAADPPVYIGLGSATVPDPDGVTELLLASACDAGVRVILSSGWAGLGSRPVGAVQGGGEVKVVDDRVLVVDGDIGHQQLFRNCAAVVHHAGAGTTHTALAAGTVGVPLPFWADQPFWAARTSALGVSTRPVPRSQWSRPRIANAIAQAVGEPWRSRRAAALGEALAAESGAHAAARRIIEIHRDRGRKPSPIPGGR
ncbi:MAG: glycosyltransferase family 1 protein [Actinobacteria bacterium]|nr:glycosyltransferase family 1 protein [Actinomycetota bacterium]